MVLAETYSPFVRLSLTVVGNGSIRVQMFVTDYSSKSRQIRLEVRGAEGTRRRRSLLYSPWVDVNQDPLQSADMMTINGLLSGHMYQIGAKSRSADCSTSAWSTRTIFRFTSPIHWIRDAVVKVFTSGDVSCSRTHISTMMTSNQEQFQDIVEYLMRKAHEELGGEVFHIGDAVQNEDDRYMTVQWAISLLERLVSNTTLKLDKRLVVRAIVKTIDAILGIDSAEISLPDHGAIELDRLLRPESRKSGKASQLLRSLKNYIKSVEEEKKSYQGEKSSSQNWDHRNPQQIHADEHQNSPTSESNSALSNTSLVLTATIAIDEPIREINGYDMSNCIEIGHRDGHTLFGALLLFWAVCSLLSITMTSIM